MTGEFSSDNPPDDIEPVVSRASGGRVVFIGTAHGLQKNIDRVDQFIRTEHPDLVLVELDPRAFAVWDMLIEEQSDLTTDPKAASFLEWRSSIVSSIRKKEFQLPKGEMVQAIETSKELSIPWEIIDLPLDAIARVAGAQDSELEAVTAVNLQCSTSDLLDIYIKKFVIFVQFVQLIDGKKAKDPSIGERILAARNEYMAQKITSWLHEPSYQKILVVCGNAHVGPLTALVNTD